MVTTPSRASTMCSLSNMFWKTSEWRASVERCTCSSSLVPATLMTVSVRRRSRSRRIVELGGDSICTRMCMGVSETYILAETGARERVGRAGAFLDHELAAGRKVLDVAH